MREMTKSNFIEKVLLEVEEPNKVFFVAGSSLKEAAGILDEICSMVDDDHYPQIMYKSKRRIIFTNGSRVHASGNPRYAQGLSMDAMFLTNTIKPKILAEWSERYIPTMTDFIVEAKPPAEGKS